MGRPYQSGLGAGIVYLLRPGSDPKGRANHANLPIIRATRLCRPTHPGAKGLFPKE